MKKFIEYFVNSVKARVPLLYVTTYEENRLTDTIRELCAQGKHFRTGRKVFTWSVTQGLVDADGKVQADLRPALRILEHIETHGENAVFLLKDLHAECTANPQVIRKLRDILERLKNGPVMKTVVMVSPSLHLPEDLQKDAVVADFPLPGREEIEKVLRSLMEANKGNARITISLTPAEIEQLCDCALGLTCKEAENAFAYALVADARLDIADISHILEEKSQIVRKTGILEFVPVQESMSEVGGLRNIKNWLAKRQGSWLPEAARWGLPAPKGVLITGVPGCGKSLTAKAISSEWRLPMLRLDAGKIFSGIVGSSEENMRKALAVAEAMSPCILWIDEIEKGFGSMSGQGDSGTSSRVFGTFLTWLQEKRKAVFLVATANDINRLPPEFLRKGRFDEVFFVDLPATRERQDILRIHLEKRLRNAEVKGKLQVDPSLLASLAQATAGFSGAELEAVVIQALFEAFSERRAIVASDLDTAIQSTVPLSVMQADQLADLRSWATTRAVPAAGREDRDSETQPPEVQAAAQGAASRAIDF